MARTTVDAAEALLDQEIPVLDKGFVRLVDYMGGDERIVSSARVSYGAGTKTVRQDRGLIHYLMRNWHTSLSSCRSGSRSTRRCPSSSRGSGCGTARRG